MLGITTAGEHLDTLAGGLYEYGVRVATGEATDDAFGFWWWAAPDGCDLEDPDAWRAANPSLAEGVGVEEDFALAARLATNLQHARIG